MSSFDRDPSGKVSKPTQKDFLHGMVAGTQHNGRAGLLGFAVGYLIGSYGKRGK